MTAPSPSELAVLLAEVTGLPQGVLRSDTSFARMGVGAPELECFARRIAVYRLVPLPKLLWECNTLKALAEYLGMIEAGPATSHYRAVGFRVGLPDVTFYE
jgi:hypothetical protein